MKPRLLIVELHHLGDAVLSLPFVRAAQRTHDVHVLCRPATRAVYDLLPTPPKVHAWDPPWADGRLCGAREAVEAARMQGCVLRALEFETAVCAWADSRAALILAETRAARRIGFPMTRANYYAADIPWRRRNLSRGRLLAWWWDATHRAWPALTHPLHRKSPTQSHLSCWEQIGEAAGTGCDEKAPWFPAPEPAAGLMSFTQSTHAAGRQILAVHAHARLGSKQWPLERWRELLMRPDVCDAFSILEIVPPLAAAGMAEGAERVETPDLPALVSALAIADAVLCHDSLPAHLAAALGKPVVTIFGSGDPDWFAPWSNRERVVRSRACPLHPCIDHCGMDRYLCLETIKLDDVAAQLALLAATKP